MFGISIGIINIILVILALFFLSIIYFFYPRKNKPEIESATPPTTPAPPPAAPSGDWKSWIPTIVILAVIVIAGYLLVANWSTVEGYFPEKTPVVAPKFGCSSPGVNDQGNLVYVLTFNEDSTTLTTMCSEPLTLGQNFSLEEVKGETLFAGSKIGAEGTVVDISQNVYKYPTAEAYPLGMLLVTVGGEPWLGIGKNKTYFKVVASNSLEVTDEKGKLLRSFPITLPKDPGGWGSKISLATNCQGTFENKKACSASFEVRQEYLK